MYSAAKAELELEKKAEKQRVHSETEKTLLKAEETKVRLEALAKDLEVLKGIPRDQLHILDSSNIVKLTESIDVAVKGYREILDANAQALQKAQRDGERKFEDAAVQLAKATDDFSASIEEIRVTLSQIWQAVARKNENLQKENAVLDKLNAILP